MTQDFTLAKLAIYRQYVIYIHRATTKFFFHTSTQRKKKKKKGKIRASVIEWPLETVHRSLGRLNLNYGEVFFESSSIQSSDERIQASQFPMLILERARRARKLGRGQHARRTRRSFLATRFSRFSSYRNYMCGDLSSILAQTWPQKRSQSA